MYLRNANAVILNLSIKCTLLTADRAENKMQTKRYKMQTGDKMQTGINMRYLCFQSNVILYATQYSLTAI